MTNMFMSVNQIIQDDGMIRISLDSLVFLKEQMSLIMTKSFLRVIQQGSTKAGLLITSDYG